MQSSRSIRDCGQMGVLKYNKYITVYRRLVYSRFKHRHETSILFVNLMK